MRTAKFKARAGMLTVMFLCSVMERHHLLQMLEEAGMPERERSELPDPEDVIGAAALDAAEGPGGTQVDPEAKMEITPAGIEMYFTGTRLEEWLAGAPDGRLELGERDSARCIAGLIYGWSTALTHTLVLAGQPLGLAELSERLESVSYAALEEHAELMASGGLIEPMVEPDGVLRYVVTDFLREGIAPIAAGARFESHYPAPDASPPDRLDVEAVFQLALPLLRLPRDVTGTCRLAARIDEEGSTGMAGATVRVKRGRVVSCAPELDDDVDAWAEARAIDWLDTLVEPQKALVEMGGDEQLAASLLAGLHERLFSFRSA